jgi:hypothetical protein
VHFRPPSVDPGVTALLWAAGLGVFIYFGLLAVGVNRAIAIVLTFLAAAGIWLFVRARGEERPTRRRS